jgi:hypothetical protein
MAEWYVEINAKITMYDISDTAVAKQITDFLRSVCSGSSNSHIIIKRICSKCRGYMTLEHVPDRTLPMYCCAKCGNREDHIETEDGDE